MICKRQNRTFGGKLLIVVITAIIQLTANLSASVDNNIDHGRFRRNLLDVNEDVEELYASFATEHVIPPTLDSSLQLLAKCGQKWTL